MASELPLQKFEWESVIVRGRIGEGSFAKVYETECEHVEYAVKKFKMLGDPISSTEWERECRTWSTLVHPNIVTLYGITYEKEDRSKPPLLVMERMKKSLSCHLRDTSPDKPGTTFFPLDAKLSVFIQVCKALLYLHSKGLVHGDLTSNNVLLNISQPGDITAKVSDFGVSRTSTGPISMSTLGTECYMPPEVSEDPPRLTSKVDVYSVGVLAIHTVTHKCPKRLPATRRTSTGLEAVCEYERFSRALKEFREEAKFLLPLIEKCLDNDPQYRPEAKEIVEELKRMKSTMAKELSLSTHSMQPVYNITHNVTSEISLSGCNVKESNLQFIGSNVNTASNNNYDGSPALCGMDQLQRALEKKSVPELEGEFTSGSPKSTDIIEDIMVPPGHTPMTEVWTTPEEETTPEGGTVSTGGENVKVDRITPEGGTVSIGGEELKVGGTTPEGWTVSKGGGDLKVGGTTPEGGTVPEGGEDLKVGGTTPEEGTVSMGRETIAYNNTSSVGGTEPLVSTSESTTTPFGGAASKGQRGGYVSVNTIKQRKKTQVIKRNSIRFKRLDYKRDQQQLRSYLPGFEELEEYYMHGCEDYGVEFEVVQTYPSYVVQLDGSLYFYSKGLSQMNRMCRGGQKVEIKVPHQGTFSVAATTNPPAVHVIVRNCDESGQPILKVLTLNLSAAGLKNQFNESLVPSFPIDVKSDKIVSVGVDGLLFVVVKVSEGEHAGRSILLGIDTHALKWSIVGICPFDLDQGFSCQLLQYGVYLLFVSCRKAAMIRIEDVLPDVAMKAGFRPESWIDIQDLPVDEGKVVVYRDQLLSVGGLVECIYNLDGDQHSPIDKVYVYHPDSAEWFPVASLQYARYCPALIVAKDQLFVVGGQVLGNGDFYAPDEISEDNPEFSPHEDDSYLATLGAPVNKHPRVDLGPLEYVQDPENVFQSPQPTSWSPQATTMQNPPDTIQGPWSILKATQGQQSTSDDPEEFQLAE